MIVVHIRDEAGVFAENKDSASEIREKTLLPALRDRQEVVLDFENVEGATQSFIHAMISQALRDYGSDVLDHIVLKSCNNSVKSIIEIVTDYM